MIRHRSKIAYGSVYVNTMKTSQLLLCLTFIAGALAVPGRDHQTQVDPTLNWQIIGGSDAEEGKFPYQISLRYDGNHRCGGSIISNTTILTAAHCVQGVDVRRLSVVVGTNKLNSGGTQHKAFRIASHKDFHGLALRNDIALVQVFQAFTFSNTIASIELETLDVGGGVDAVLSGWGFTSYPGSGPNNLQYINLKTVTVKQCRWSLGPLRLVRKSQVCTLTREGEGACHGDSGGPLVAAGRQIGIVSWGRPCAIGKPDVFTRVSSYIDWINEQFQ